MGLFSKARKRDRRTTGDEPGRATEQHPPPSPEELQQNTVSDGLSYLMPPADLPTVSPEAHKLAMQAAVAGMMGDDAASLEQFRAALRIVHEVPHRSSEARLLYNLGLALYKLGDHEQALEALGTGRLLAEMYAEDLAREARKLQREREELLLDAPGVEVLGAPELEQDLLVRYSEALAIVYDAAGQPEHAARCREEVERLVRRGT